MFWNGMMWKDLKKAIHERKLANTPELQLFSKEERTDIPLSQCAGQTHNYWKCLSCSHLLPKGSKPVTESKGSHTFTTPKYEVLDHFPLQINEQV